MRILKTDVNHFVSFGVKIEMQIPKGDNIQSICNPAESSRIKSNEISLTMGRFLITKPFEIGVRCH